MSGIDSGPTSVASLNHNAGWKPDLQFGEEFVQKYSPKFPSNFGAL